MKKGKLKLMLLLSLLTHISISAALVYMPHQESQRGNTYKPSEDIIWGNLIVKSSGEGPGSGGGHRKSGETHEGTREPLQSKTKHPGHRSGKPRWKDRNSSSSTAGVKEVTTIKREKRLARENSSSVKSLPILEHLNRLSVIPSGQVTSTKKIDDTSAGEISKGEKGDTAKCNSCRGSVSNTASTGRGFRSNGMDKGGSGYGSGDEGGGGRGGVVGSSTLKAYLNSLREEIEKHKYYPPIARSRGIEGTVYVKFYIDNHGRPGEISLERSSGSRILDESALMTIKQIEETFVTPPPQIRELNITIPITFRLVEE